MFGVFFLLFLKIMEGWLVISNYIIFCLMSSDCYRIKGIDDFFFVRLLLSLFIIKYGLCFDYCYVVGYCMVMYYIVMFWLIVDYKYDNL